MSANGLESYTMHVVDAESAPALESLEADGSVPGHPSSCATSIRRPRPGDT